ncbi:MAG: SRPBCC domain-containing protein [Bacteroidia bacterium]|nr:SRPBCC domain-containing protein [Bacteroidia bacterium]NNM22451.1 SRPBCC domain-containing protein [Flavobacteriaceae bacterium]
MKTTDPPIVVEQFIKASREELWAAITDRSQMIQWYFENIPEFEDEVGFQTSFPVYSEDRIFTHIWKITQVIPMKKIGYEWTYKEYPGKGLVTFEIQGEDEALTLRLTNTVREDFPQDIPEFKRKSCIDGWNYFIQQRLKEYFANL